MKLKGDIPQIKICGITLPEQAEQCVALGADAIGCVFFTKSPRDVSDAQAKEIGSALGGKTSCVGVFVDADRDTILKKVERCGLTGVQLHGNESPELIAALRGMGLLVIKTLFSKRIPKLEAARRYAASSALLAECGTGSLPGGNAQDWHWADARPMARHAALVLAGGLTPDNVVQAVSAALPDAVDVSSGVETSSGKKDMSKVASFIANLRGAFSGTTNGRPLKKIF
ncbi:MAG: phosphoribosylanthranilate isomerase [Deltaproteobacteria bacterium CG_4_8_14_3_um_filter_51_11]|nr:phosphoribosylanthranilate isomerase [bacterium]OIP43729.1 MAG: phosphoribosylanthranilate isomerase [Desulfobacteraceae bacterium CG2_30_51_40]PIP48163.1 MAG: phosphoribosylanthranilate isomerase [Deltaproteobacteria bacterium CG23_combo_of_CG06-09_8_20_14_all_51_20]PIV99337.1 MAG: phosphoribosylanthranilate isomerase [Deltaproteobacteria bacterium CG17_big_fil_post_rev_8_21_14_2_50_51_6]PIX19456.1 MAG: phosphoribosylanthranilate isomerase [Deltaproteobacteria bacterium CG_4_8_14_3_um_filte